MASLDKKIQAMINEADVDGDGQINFLEFDKQLTQGAEIYSEIQFYTIYITTNENSSGYYR